MRAALARNQRREPASGNQRIASTDEGGLDGLCDAFERWVSRLEAEGGSGGSAA